MALPKAMRFVIVLLAIIYSLEHQGYRTSLNVFIQKLMGTKASGSHAIEKRVASLDSSEYVFQAVLNLSDLEHLRAILSSNTFITLDESNALVTNIKATTELLDADLVLELHIPVSSISSNGIDVFRETLRRFSFPYIVNQTLNVTGVNMTTVCYPNSTGALQCQCEDQFVWSCDQCKTYGVCGNLTTHTCGCINGLPSDGGLCEPITSIPPCPLPYVDADLVLELHIPVSSISSNGIDVFRETLRRFSFPYIVNQTLNVTGVNMTTVCYPNSTGALQCQCEDQFVWSCDQCKTYGVCGNLTTHTCGCINGLPSDGGLCEPITSIPPCPLPYVDADLVLELHIPVSSISSNGIDVFRETLRRFSFPYIVNQTLNVTGVNMTTVCYPNSTGALQCQCEDQFVWSCDQCKTYGVCGNLTTHTCGCINGLPSDGGLCEPITSIPPCPLPYVDADLVLELHIPVSSISSNGFDVFRETLRRFSFPYIVNQTLNVTGVNMTTVDADLVLELHIPVSSISSNGIDVFRETLRRFSFPYIVNQTLNVTGVNMTTVCYPNSTGALQCQCEDQFVWSCDQCKNYGVCGNLTTHTCGCINGLPSDGGLCEPITSIPPCPLPYVDADLVLELHIPVSSISLNGIDVFRETLRRFSFPYIVNQTLNVTGVNMTTVCYPNSTGALQCQCEDQFVWSCDQCKNYGVCVDADLVLELHIPVSSISSNGIDVFRETLRRFSFPYIVNQTLNLSFAMNLDYKPAYNNLSNPVYQDVNAAIQKQSKMHIPTLKSARLTRFRSGSTVVDYSITATAFEESQIEALKLGIFKKLAESYRMIFDSPTSITFAPPFWGSRVILNCGPIPTYLNFNGSWTAEWRRDGELILEDSLHIFAKNGTLTVKQFYLTDNGSYECRLTERHLFRQKSDTFFSYKDTPLVRVSPVKQRVKCEVGKRVSLTCSVNSPYEVEFKDVDGSDKGGGEITHMHEIEKCPTSMEKFTCQLVNSSEFKNEIRLEFPTGAFICVDESEFGVGNPGDRAEGACDSTEVGKRIAECHGNGTWKVVEEQCILKEIQELLDQSASLTNNSLAAFLKQLRNVTLRFKEKVVESSPNINAIVKIFNNVATSSLNILITETEMKDILFTADVLTADESRQQWDFLNTKSTVKSSVAKRNVRKANTASSLFLQSLETITSNINSNSFDIVTPSILLNKTTFTDNFSGDFNSSVEIDIPEANGGNKSITVITFSSMDNVLPARDEVNSTLNVINGKVVLVQSVGTVNNISFAFDIINNTLGNPQCVFWNFSLFDGLGGWDDEGCNLTFNVNNTVTCTCNHLTSFSILMSPSVPDFPLLDYITYIGVGISMASLVICLIIEAVIWRKIRKSTTSYLRHVSIVNIALSLLIANIWFIIAAAISDAEVKNQPACTAATFFIHFFYLALFFWMLASALLLLYRTVSVFGGDLSKRSLLAIGFCLGYGAPLIIAIITIAVTAPANTYIRETGVCWLNWNQSMALLAFVIPALIIVVINLGILFLVLYKMLRRRAVVDAAQAAERNALVVIARTLAFLTPFFGLTWGLGVGTMTDPHNIGIHVAFAFFNSLQGFFILLFGTLLDKKVRTEIALMSQTSRSGTRSTSGGTSSSNGLGIFRNWRRGRDGYNVSSNESGASHSFINT
ncbi:adhesion G protein-coupled receptor F5-like [Hippoglossus hippoglossus]|uniref:adhesion G protein-coupled receptor F5-like n=1 Tax=Hippoglossus hippoglossus TaxID=8267 RepID=UPI00148E3535|nr:adhesion G protein-coupled receptor F5-like [Hippoglossus hippoglossus]